MGAQRRLQGWGCKLAWGTDRWAGNPCLPAGTLLRSERRQRTAPGELPSTYAQDVAAIVASSASGSRAGSLPLTPSGSYGEAAGLWMQAPRDSAGLSSPTAAGTRGLRVW